MKLSLKPDQTVLALSRLYITELVQQRYKHLPPHRTLLMNCTFCFPVGSLGFSDKCTAPTLFLKCVKLNYNIGRIFFVASKGVTRMKKILVRSTLQRIFPETHRNIEKASHTFVGL